MEGKMIIFSAPSGSGKTTLVKHLLNERENIDFSISACSREKRPGETEGKDYYFISPDDFRKRIENDEFVEWEEVYTGNYYGTLKSEIERIWSTGKAVIFDVDVVGGIDIKKRYSNKALSVFIKPPSIEELQRRLLKRSTESPEQIKYRIEKTEKELKFAKDFDVIIVNEDLEEAKKLAIETVDKFLQK